jgi:VWFA-related protein
VLSRASVCVAVFSACLLAQGQNEPPVFKSGVDVLSVDVQVVDSAGHPVAGLGPDAFTVTVAGKKRRVISAERVDVHQPAKLQPAAAPSAPRTALPIETAAPGDGPAYFLTVDCLSFEPTQTAAVIRAAKNFVSRLGAGERIGVFAYPTGPKVEATANHDEVLAALDQVYGQSHPPPGFTTETRPSPHLIVDATEPHRAAAVAQIAGQTDELYRVALQEEAQNTASIGMLSAFMRALRTLPGRKVVVLVSSGLISADKPGYRPDLGDRGSRIGQEAAASNATIYSLFVDQTFLGYGAGRNRLEKGDRINRDAEILNRYLDQVSGASGGTMLTSLTDDGTAAFNRILDETSSYYLLGVEAESSDRDGKPHALAVKTKAPGATVRARSWVMIPKPAGEPNRGQ